MNGRELEPAEPVPWWTGKQWELSKASTRAPQLATAFARAHCRPRPAATQKPALANGGSQAASAWPPGRTGPAGASHGWTLLTTTFRSVAGRRTGGLVETSSRQPSWLRWLRATSTGTG